MLLMDPLMGAIIIAIAGHNRWLVIWGEISQSIGIVRASVDFKLHNQFFKNESTKI